MRTNSNNQYQRSSAGGNSRLSRGAQAPIRGFDDPLPEDITLLWILRRIFSGFKLIWVAIRFRWKRMNGGTKFAGIRISWLKLGLACLVVFMVTQKDIRFSINLKAPLANAAKQHNPLAAKTSGVDKLGLADALPFNGGSKKEEAVPTVETLDSESVHAYTRRFSKVAVAEMRKFGIPASIKLAQAIVESNAGSSVDAAANNHFGAPLAGEDYISAWENWRAHSLYLKREHADLFDSAFGYRQWAKGLAKQGYNPDRKYADKLIGVIEKYGLNQLDE